MAVFPYVFTPDRLKKCFAQIQTAGVPSKVDRKYLEASGFRGKNDRRFITLLKFIEFIDASGVPMPNYVEYRDRSKARVVLASAIRKAYDGLFGMYPDAFRRDNEALRNYFSTQTEVAESTLAKIVWTFRVLCDMADFEAAPAALPPEAAVSAAKPTVPKVTPLAFPVNINIQITLPETKDVSIYEDIFKAMRKHLLKPEAKE